MTPTFFKTQKDFRKWLEKNHLTEKELLVGFYKTKSGKESINWSQSVDEALCFGWIDGMRKSIDEISYTIRFTPRRAKSIWSNVNLKKMEELKKNNLLFPAGIKIFELREENRLSIYSFEQKELELPEAFKKKLRANKKAWKFFDSMPRTYKRSCAWWIISAKREETKISRMNQLIIDSANGEKLKQFRYRDKNK